MEAYTCYHAQKGSLEISGQSNEKTFDPTKSGRQRFVRGKGKGNFIPMTKKTIEALKSQSLAEAATGKELKNGGEKCNESRREEIKKPQAATIEPTT